MYNRTVGVQDTQGLGLRSERGRRKGKGGGNITSQFDQGLALLHASHPKISADIKDYQSWIDVSLLSSF